jgi:hypothetical protein
MPTPRDTAIWLLNRGQETPTKANDLPSVRAQLAIAAALLDVASAIRESKC